MRRSFRQQTPLFVALILILVLTMTTILVMGGGHVTRAPSSSEHATQTPQPSPTPGHAALAGNDPVGADFSRYSQLQGGTASLGKPITPEMPNGQFVTQLYQNMMLGFTHNVDAVAPQPIVKQLITTSAAIPLVQGNPFTYANLLPETVPNATVPAPPNWQAGGSPAGVGIFIPTAQREGVAVGYYIPPYFAATLVNHANWSLFAGMPLTQALPIVLSGSTQQAFVQAFENLILIALPASSQGLSIALRSSGLDWLATFGRPSLAIEPQTAVYATTATTLLDSSQGNPTATFTTPFAATLVGNSAWHGNVLWYQIRWQNLAQERTGWIAADQVAFGQYQANGPEIADLGALSSSLSTYANQLGDNLAMSVYLPAQNRFYNFHANEDFETASTIKVVILITLLSQAEAANRPLTSTEQSEATAMIENSDNDAAQAIYDEEGGNIGIANYMAAIGITDMNLNLNGFGTTTTSPTTMIQILEDLRTVSILTPSDCQYTLSLMSQIASDERMGIGDTAPAGATVQMKDGYGVEDDGLNVMVTIGSITYQGQTYDVAVFTRRETTLQQGIDYVNTICQDIALGLVGKQ